jgi:AbrB family looped-hinge helix DNA binding protein
MSNVYHSKLGEGRRIAIPAEACEKMNLSPGDPVSIELRDEGLLIVPYAEVIRKVQAAFAPYRKPGESVADELLAERRLEAAREGDE